MVHARRWLDSPAAYRLVQAVAAVALLLSMALAVQQYQLTACLERYAEASARAQAARAEAAEADRAAVDEVFAQVAFNPRAAIAKLREYNEKRERADEQRRQNPVPPPPSTRC